MRAVEAALAAVFAWRISSIRSMLWVRRKVSSGSFMEMTVAAKEKQGESPRRC
jgi:hypothetical protein